MFQTLKHLNFAKFWCFTSNPETSDKYKMKLSDVLKIPNLKHLKNA